MKKFLTIIAVLYMCISAVMAQGGELLDTETAPFPGLEVPVDGGISLLLAAGVAYGIHKRRTPRRNKGEKG